MQINFNVVDLFLNCPTQQKTKKLKYIMFTSFVAVPLYIQKYHMDINFIVAEVYVNCPTQQKQKK